MRASASALRMRLAVAGGADAEALLVERARHQLADLAMIVDDQDVRAGVHGANLVRAGLIGQKHCNDICRMVSLTQLVTKSLSTDKLE